MSIRFFKAEKKQLEKLCELYQQVIASMQEKGLRQWEWEVYPTRAQLEEDVRLRQLYCVEEEGELCGAFVLCGELEEEYSAMEWHYGVKPCTLHRVALHTRVFGAEMIGRVISFVRQEAVKLGFDSLRMDVCCEDRKMLSFCQAAMKREAGRTFFENFGMEYVCLETPLSGECPMLPLRMVPSYRYSDMTPWGSTELRTAFGRDIPDERTGEAMEVSVIPGLESFSTAGETLTELIRENGAALVGDSAGKPFPLLVKLLAARESLSVQVHPDDDYAREHENSLGKTEAWVILKAEEGASICYGLKPGVTLDMLRSGLESGEDIEPLIDRAPARPGDVFFMPAGMVHAIGPGILLYEIQQSSDITYRLWDFNRVGSDGKKRPLHIRQSLDVIDPELRGARARMPEAGDNEVTNLLDVPAFRLDCACANGECELGAGEGSFRLLTALSSLLLSWEGDAMQLRAGDTVFLPASCPPVSLTGVGRALISRT